MDYKNKMKTLGFLTAIFVSLSVGAGPEISAQDYVPTPVTVSKEKVKVDGKLYYSHIVLERQTLYSICKAYGVTAAEVYEANPTLIDTGLKKNAIILIPVSGQVTDRNTTVKEGKDTTDTTKGKPAKQKKKKKEKEGDFIVHTVRWYEDLDVISEKYGIPVEAIMQANGLSGRKLSNRQKLKIPVVAMHCFRGFLPERKKWTPSLCFRSMQEPKGRVRATWTSIAVRCLPSRILETAESAWT